jgi:prephenate dehydrogenase
MTIGIVGIGLIGGSLMIEIRNRGFCRQDNRE